VSMTRKLFIAVTIACLLLWQASARAGTTLEIVKRAKPAVVEIVALDKKGSPMKFGTGFFISSGGQLVTNYNVVDGAISLLAIDYLGIRFPLEPVKYDPGRDLALLKCQVKEVPFLKLRESDYYHPNEITEGEKVIVIGNPSGFFRDCFRGNRFRVSQTFLGRSANANHRTNFSGLKWFSSLRRERRDCWHCNAHKGGPKPEFCDCRAGDCGSSDRSVDG